MYYSHIEIAAILTFVLFALPLFFFAVKFRLFKEFQFEKLRRSINFALPVQIIVGLLLWCPYFFLEMSYTVFSAIIIETSSVYSVIGFVFYFAWGCTI
ncbi:MAG: hypothetical protein IPG07_16470 [Crocinitomicaceae bacterium]|nr:hypothetical protein [Crocinitomicaceae bacterium]